MRKEISIFIYHLFLLMASVGLSILASVVIYFVRRSGSLGDPFEGLGFALFIVFGFLFSGLFFIVSVFVLFGREKKYIYGSIFLLPFLLLVIWLLRFNYGWIPIAVLMGTFLLAQIFLRVFAKLKKA